MLTEQKKMMMLKEAGPDRIYAFSDGVFAIIITIMVLELKKPESATFHALFVLWPTWISYAASYLFIAIVWINHHYLMRHASQATLRLMWLNFGHLFSVSLIPFLTAWIAESKLASVPVAMYAVVFLLVNVTYLALVWETLCKDKDPTITNRPMWQVHVRSFITLAVFSLAAVLSFWSPFLGFTLVCFCLLLYLRPEPHFPQIKRPKSGIMEKKKSTDNKNKYE